MNSVIGSGIYLLPQTLAANMGPAGILCVASAALACLLILLCYADAGSRFDETGGAYLYAKHAFGGFVGFEVGWISWVARVFAWAALARAFSTTLFATFAISPDARLADGVAALLVTALTAVNVASARFAASISNALLILKLVPLLLFAGAGLFFVRADNGTPFAPRGYASFGETTAIFVFAFAGFESLAIPAGEAHSPRRMVPIALCAVLAVTSLTYLLVVFVTIGTYPAAASSNAPVVAAAQAFAGSLGRWVIAVGAVVSLFGVNAALAFNLPRTLFALADQQQLPRWIAATHAARHTPWAAGLVSGLATWACIIWVRSFEELAAFSVIARMCQYLATCAAVLSFRLREPRHVSHATPFRRTLGPVLPLVAIAVCAWLITTTRVSRTLPAIAALGVGALIYVAYRFLRSTGRSTASKVPSLAGTGRAVQRVEREPN